MTKLVIKTQKIPTGKVPSPAERKIKTDNAIKVSKPKVKYA